MSESSYKRIVNNNVMKPEALEEVYIFFCFVNEILTLTFQIKLGIVKFLSHGVFSDDDILIHLIVAASDTRFAVANLADNELKKVVG